MIARSLKVEIKMPIVEKRRHWGKSKITVEEIMGIKIKKFTITGNNEFQSKGAATNV